MQNRCENMSSGFQSIHYSNCILRGYNTMQSNKYFLTFQESMSPQYPQWQFGSESWTHWKEEMCWLYTTAARSVANHSSEALTGQFVPPESLNTLSTLLIPCGARTQKIFIWFCCLFDTNNFVSNLRTIEHENYILCQFLHTVLS